MCVPIFLQKFSVGREFFLSPTLNIIQPIKLDIEDTRRLRNRNLSRFFLCKKLRREEV